VTVIATCGQSMCSFVESRLLGGHQDYKIIVGGQALQDVTEFMRHARRNGNLAGDSGPAAGERDVDVPLAIENPFLNCDVKSSFACGTLNKILKVLMLRTTATGQPITCGRL
jgi:hypothetical protein